MVSEPTIYTIYWYSFQLCWVLHAVNDGSWCYIASHAAQKNYSVALNQLVAMCNKFRFCEFQSDLKISISTLNFCTNIRTYTYEYQLWRMDYAVDKREIVSKWISFGVGEHSKPEIPNILELKFRNRIHTTPHCMFPIVLNEFCLFVIAALVVCSVLPYIDMDNGHISVSNEINWLRGHTIIMHEFVYDIFIS